jgi:hypothetical protein
LLACGSFTHGWGGQGAIGLNFFGLAILGPIETNINGSGRALVWLTSNPTNWRAIDNYEVPPGYTCTQGVSGWGSVETTNGFYDWSLFDLVWAKLKAQGVTDVVFSFQGLPSWWTITDTACLARAGGRKMERLSGSAVVCVSATTPA